MSISFRASPDVVVRTPRLAEAARFYEGVLGLNAKAALLSAGCAVIEENPAVPRCYIRDPYGLVFNIEQRAPLLA